MTSPVLPSWLTERACYEPAADRDGFLRKNLLSLASVLTKLRAEAPSSEGLSQLDRLLARVPGAIRLVATLVLVTCVSMARNMAFVWAITAGWLVILASRPAARIRAVFLPALVAGLVAALVNLPALLLGQANAPLRMGFKTLATVGLVANISQALGSEGLIAALRSWHLPPTLVTTLDLTLRDIVILGESALSLSEALALRSVGRDRTKTGSAAGVMGVTFLHAHTMATARAEAMELRGYGARDATASTRRRQPLGWPTLAYLALLACLIALFVYLEGALT